MKVTNIRIRRTDKSISLLADCKIRPVGWDTVYLTFDKKYADWIAEDASPFAAALLVPAMYQGEDLIIEGSISAQLYEGMQRIMEIMLGWNVGAKRINIKVAKITPDIVDSGGSSVAAAHSKNVATFFSGGVDSFYTYLKHQHDAVDPITHFILVNGNDIDLRNKKLWMSTRENVQSITDAGGIELVTVDTNLQSLLEPMVSPDWTHGASLAAVGLAIRNGFKKIYIPSTFSTEQQVPYGSHPDTDKYWGTEHTVFDHDGVEASRLNKVEWQIAKSPLALKYLRVCYMNTKQSYNCGRCEKCLRTMIALLIAGKLDQAETFPHTIDPKRLALVVSRAGFGPVLQNKENLAALRAKNLAPELQAAIEKGLSNVIDTSRTAKDIIFMKFMYIDHRYTRGKLHRLYRIIKPL